MVLKSGSIFWGLVVQNLTSKDGFMIADRIPIIGSIRAVSFLCSNNFMETQTLMVEFFSWKMIHGFDYENKTLLYWVHMPGENGCNCMTIGQLTHKWYSDEYTVIENKITFNISLRGVNRNGFVIKADITIMPS